MTCARNKFLLVSAGLLGLIAVPATASAQLERSTVIFESPCPGPSCPEQADPQAVGPRLVYLNFDGVTLTASNNNDDATQNISAIVNSSTENIPAFNANQLWSSEGMSTSQIKNMVLAEMESIHAPYDVTFTMTRPNSGSYVMVVFGGSCTTTVGMSGCAGVALGDCGDFLPSNIAFVFPGSLSASQLAPTAAQEAAHTFGLGHTNDQDDVMYPEVIWPPPEIFGAGSIPDGSGCPQSATFQDSHAQMMAIIGPRGQDVSGPSVTITSPGQGAPVMAGTQVTVSVTDQSAIDYVSMQIDGVEEGNLTNGPYNFSIPGTLSAGEHSIRVRAYDVGGYQGFDTVNVYMTDGSEDPCSGDGDCDDGWECVNDICVPDNGIDGGELGDMCTTNEECFSSLCGSVGGEDRCTQSCNEGTPCPDGFECISNTACWPADGGDGGGGGTCSVGSGTGSLPILALMFGAFLLVWRRRQ